MSAMDTPGFAPFEASDWDAFAGAETFEDGSLPLIDWYLKVDGLHAVAIIDGNGFYMGVTSPDGDVVAEVRVGNDPIAGTFLPRVARFIATLKSDYTTGELIDMGLEPQRGN